MKTRLVALLVAIFSFSAVAQEMSVQLKPRWNQFIVGEPVVVNLELINITRSALFQNATNSNCALLIEISKGPSGANWLKPFNRDPVFGWFSVNAGKRIKRTAELDKFYPLLDEGKYLVRAVLVYEGMRYESRLSSFDVVSGIKVQDGIQMFSNRKHLKRTFRLVYWSRNQTEHLFLRIQDDPGKKVWDTVDLGMVLRTEPPKLDIAPNGEVTVLHRATQDAFLRAVIWSLPENLEIVERDQLLDPAISASQRAKSLYTEMVDDKKDERERPWWKFW